MWEIWKMGSSPEGSVGNFTSTSFRKMGCKTLGKARVLPHDIWTDAFNTEQFTTDFFCASVSFPFCLPPILLQICNFWNFHITRDIGASRVWEHFSWSKKAASWSIAISPFPQRAANATLPITPWDTWPLLERLFLQNFKSIFSYLAKANNQLSHPRSLKSPAYAKAFVPLLYKGYCLHIQYGSCCLLYALVTYNNLSHHLRVVLTVLYILYCRLDLGLKTLSVPEEPRGFMIWVRRRKSLNRKPYSSLLLLAL